MVAKPKTRPVVFYCSEELHAALVDLARLEGETMSVLLRRAARKLVGIEYSKTDLTA